MKYCSNCGAKLENDAQFCDNCGTPTTPEAAAPETPTQEVPVSETSAPEAPVQESTPQEASSAETASQQPVSPKPTTPKEPSKFVTFLKKHTVPVIIAAVLLVAVIGVSIFFATRPTTISLNEYVTVEYDGYNGQGIARVDFDTDAFREDYGKKIKIKGHNIPGMDAIAAPSEFLIVTCVDGKLDKDEGLSNGDKILFQWNCDEEKAKEVFHVKLSYDDVPFTVEGLDEADAVNPFNDLKLEFDGRAPYATVSLGYSCNEDYACMMDFNVEPNRNLKNGDTITITIEDADDPVWQETLLESYGKTLSETKMTYTVEGLDEYLADISLIPDDVMATMDAKVEENINDEATYWADFTKVSNMEHVGCYLLNRKPDDTLGGNELYVVYKVDAVTDLETEDGPIHEEFSYYTTVSFGNVVLKPDGSVAVDLSLCTRPFHQFSRDVNNMPYYFYGFETLEELDSDLIEAKSDRYTSTTDIVL